MDVPVEFEDIRFIRATSMPVNGKVDLTVMIHYGTGHFEVSTLLLKLSLYLKDINRS